MKKHFISVNGEKRTGEMSVFEAVEALADFKALAEENDKIEIHSLPDKWAIKENGKINQRRIFKTEEEADAEFWKLKPENFDKPLEAVGVREFFIWYRANDEKDFVQFYTDTPDLSEAVEEAVKHLRGSFAIDYDGEVVSRYGDNKIREQKAF